MMEMQFEELLVDGTVVCEPGFTPDALPAIYKAETFDPGRLISPPKLAPASAEHHQ
jgi:hypothetical protein